MNLLFRQKMQWKESERKYSFEDLKKIVSEMLYEYTEPAMEDMYLEEQDYVKWTEHRRMISECIRNCSVGNYGAKENVLELMESFLTEKVKLRREQLLRILPFDKPENMSSWQQLESLIFYFDKEKKNSGYECLCDRFGWNQNGYVVSKKELRSVYQKIHPEFSHEEEKIILVKLLYAATVGLGVIDTLNQQSGYIEEIQIGMSGKNGKQYNYKEILSGNMSEEQNNKYSVHVMAAGQTLWLDAISFGTEEELQRVLRNLVKGAGGGELTKKNPMMVVDTRDGRRIAVSRPPVTDSWIGLIRKFDTVKEVVLEKLCEECSEILPGLLRQLVRSGRNMAITGEMASGKTTLFRACLAETKRDKNLRVIEADSFELNVREFLPTANSVTMRVTEQTPAEEVLSFARKTTGQIFAIGEINSVAMAAMTMDLSKISSQLFFSAHYLSTEHMISDFINAKLCMGGYAEEKLAEAEVVRCMGFDVHLCVKQGKRYVKYINEIIPGIDKGKNTGRTFRIHPIYLYDEEKEQGKLINKPGEISYERAKQWLSREEYMEFVRFFENKISSDMSLRKTTP